MQQMMMIAQRIAAGGVASVTWDPAAKTAATVLSMSNIRASTTSGSSGNYASARSTKAVQGLGYFSAQLTPNGTGDVIGLGIADAAFPLATTTRWVGDGTNSVGIWGPATAGYFNGGSLGISIGNGNLLEIAVRAASRRVWIRANGGSWNGGGDPSADTSPTAVITGSGPLYLVTSIDRSGASSARFIDIAPDAASTTGAVPVGFTAANWAA